MKRFSLINPLFAAILALSAPTVLSPVLTTGVFAHVGHGDEFQATGGVQRVPVNAASDQLLGIEVKPIAPATGGGKAVMIPVTSMVEADGKQLVFVRYENFYEPVPITTGASKGDLIEVTQGLSIGEKLVTQGSLTLYAESRKTQSPSTSAANSSPKSTTNPTTSTQPNSPASSSNANAANTNVANTNAATNAANTSSTSQGGFPLGILALAVGGAVVLVGAIAVMGNRKKKGGF